jgi:hypothetical protein
VKRLPASGLAVILLGVGHDLSELLGDDTEYLLLDAQAVVDARE